ncbi:MAG: biopolymer transporter ExbD [Verrucomicrobiota bacterium]|nr:biopolymer transporter ExbD [Verrucomicrobiota bacterium]
MSGHGKKRKKAEQFPEEDPEFQIAPMIDVLLVLLTFFMSIASTEVLQKAKGLELPVAKNAKDKEKNKREAIINVFWMTDSGSVSVDGKPKSADLAQMTGYINAKVDSLLSEQEKLNFRVLIRADKQVRYSYLQEVMKACAQAKIVNITFSTVDKEE